MNSLDDIATEVMFGSFKPAQKNPYVYDWINARYARLWTAFEWKFKIAEAAAMATVAGSRYLTLPADFGMMRNLFDDTGVNEIPFLESAVFNRQYLGGRILGQTGKPEAFTVVDNRVVLGPVPNAVYTFYGEYKRCLICDDGSGGAGVRGVAVVGPMRIADAATDKPWGMPPEHYEILVVGARSIGLKLVNDTAWFSLEQQHDDLVQGMVADNLLHDDDSAGGNRQWGRDYL